jgi:VWFA-related protein
MYSNGDPRKKLLTLVVLVSLYVFTNAQVPQQGPVLLDRAPQDKIKIFTEEVVIPLFVYDNQRLGPSKASLGPEDIVLVEDHVHQEVKSIRRVPAHVMFILDTAGELNPAMRTTTTGEIATRIVADLQASDEIALLQSGGGVQLIQDWTRDKKEVLATLKSKLLSGKRSHLVSALNNAIARLREVPAGNRHLVLITDGVDTSSAAPELTDAIRQLLISNTTVHVIGYTAIGRKTIQRQNPLFKITSKKRKTAKDIVDEILNPTEIPEYQRRNKIYLIIDTDVPMRRKRSEYREATEESEKWLTSLAEETGGVVIIPSSVEQMIARSHEVAREIDVQYVLTYKPKRSLALVVEEEYRKIRVTPRQAGIQVRTRPGYIALPR